MGLLAVPYRAAFGGVVVPTTPGYLLRHGQIAEGLGGDILLPCCGFLTTVAFPWLLCLSLVRSFTVSLSLEYWSGHLSLFIHNTPWSLVRGLRHHASQSIPSLLHLDMTIWDVYSDLDLGSLLPTSFGSSSSICLLDSDSKAVFGDLK